MADLKISQLPEVTSLITSDILPAVNGGLTKRVSVQNLNNSLPLTTFVQNASSGWGAGAPGVTVATAQYSFNPPYIGFTDNLVNNADNFPRWNTEVFNTRPTAFEFFGSGTTTARVHIKETGYYLFTSQISYFDLWNGMRFTVKLFRAEGVSSAMSLVQNIESRVFPGLVSNPPGQTLSNTTAIQVTAPGYYTIGLTPTANSPFPSDPGTGTTQPRFTIVKLLPL